MKEILRKSQEVLASLTAKEAEVTAPTTTVFSKTTYIGTVYMGHSCGSNGRIAG